jgi:hypothetical protein
VEEDCRSESGPISKPTSSRLDLLNRRVDRFGDGVCRLQLYRIQNSPQMCLDRSTNLNHRLQSATRDPAPERLPVLFRDASIEVRP